MANLGIARMLCYLLFMVLMMALYKQVEGIQLDIYLVHLSLSPLVYYRGPLQDYTATSLRRGRFVDMSTKEASDYGSYLIGRHDALLERTLQRGSYKKVYSYNYLVNAMAVYMSSKQAALLKEQAEVIMVEKDRGVQKATTYTPWYMGLPMGPWQQFGKGGMNAGEGIVIGLVDTGINPKHPSFSDDNTTCDGNNCQPYGTVSGYSGTCEVAEEFPKGSCNKKLVGARHFADAAIAKGLFNATIHFASPIDIEGHGTHTASTAAGNMNVPVVVAGTNYGTASGIAHRAHVAMYRAIYPGFGGFLADVVAAIEQAVKDGVDVLSLSIGPSSPPSSGLASLSLLDVATLSAIKAGVFVTQAAGNQGPGPLSMRSFSPWICTVAAAIHDRSYPNSILLGDQTILNGIGLAPGTNGYGYYNLIAATDAQKNMSDPNSSNVAECQDSSMIDKKKAQGKILICSYSVNFFFGDASIHNVDMTARNLSTAGVILLGNPELDGVEYGALPFRYPTIVLPSYKDSVTLMSYYYNVSLASSNGPFARIMGGTHATFKMEAAKVAMYSSRGPCPLDSKYNVAEILKPNVMAPGSMIWAGWSPVSRDLDAFNGETFAMISGTSMATPHIAGIAAMIIQKYPKISPAGVLSALSTTALVSNMITGDPLVAVNPSLNTSMAEGFASPFDFGSGEVNPEAALNPGIIFDAGFTDYINYLCSLPGISNTIIKNITGSSCNISSSSSNFSYATDLNTPYIVVANLTKRRVFPRTVTNIGNGSETYVVSEVNMPDGVSVSVKPERFTLSSGQPQRLRITLTPSKTSMATTLFGSIILTGNLWHQARISISIIPPISNDYNAYDIPTTSMPSK